jgi:hypothetical protein
VAGTWRSLVAHLTGGQGVAGSNPVVPTDKRPGQGPDHFSERGPDDCQVVPKSHGISHYLVDLAQPRSIASALRPCSKSFADGCTYTRAAKDRSLWPAHALTMVAGTPFTAR